MDVQGSRVGIVGGSIAGCAAAIALQRLGCEVTILERSSTGLRDRGSGIAIPIPLRDQLIESGYLPPDYAAFRVVGRRWLVADGTDAGQQRWVQPGAAMTNNWGVLWRGLRSHIGDAEYRDGADVVAVEQSESAVSVELAGGEALTFDALVAADGYKSALRSHVHPTSAPEFAGYVLWRGNFPASRLTDTDAWHEVVASREWVTVGFDGGHGVMYPIPDFDARGEEQLRVNWAIYAPTPQGLTITEPSSIPPGAVTDDVYAQLDDLIDRVIPPRLQPLFTSPQDEVSIQPIYDELVDSYVAGRLLLIGDAATLSRPHTGSGATKAMQDALTLETLGRDHSTWAELLAAYDADRAPTGRTLVELGRRIGRDQVEQTPPWAEMGPDDFEAWAAGTLSGETLYFWGNEGDADD